MKKKEIKLAREIFLAMASNPTKEEFKDALSGDASFYLDGITTYACKAAIEFYKTPKQMDEAEQF